MSLTSWYYFIFLALRYDALYGNPDSHRCTPYGDALERVVYPYSVRKCKGLRKDNTWTTNNPRYNTKFVILWPNKPETKQRWSI